MVHVYVLKSKADAATYVGMGHNVRTRLREHNVGKNRYTKGHMPWQLIYTETFIDWSTARVREST